jgi:hypothetical protein
LQFVIGEFPKALTFNIPRLNSVGLCMDKLKRPPVKDNDGLSMLPMLNLLCEASSACRNASALAGAGSV